MPHVEPQIQYCRTSDGRSIAYFAMGSGPVLIGTSAHIGMTIARDMEIPAMRRIAELTSQAFTYVRYDPHGGGLSDRRDDDLTVESFVRDIEAVADAVTAEPHVIFANGAMTSPAIVYAAQHPDRLTHLLLWMVGPWPRSWDTPANRQIRDLALKDWRMATESGVRAVDNWEHDSLASQMAAMMRESVTPETYVKFEEARDGWDVSEYLQRIETPTLIMHPRNHPYFPPDVAQRTAAEVPGARLALIDSATVLFPDASISFVAGQFLGTVQTRQERRDRNAQTHASGTTIILFADIVDSTALTERMGDAAFRERARALDDALRAAITDAGGTAIDGKLLGDGVLATFPAASQAIDAALRCAAAGNDGGLPLHLGIHAGDVIREQNNVYGGAVNIASRISGLSAPGEVLVSDIVRGLARTSAGVTFEDRGEHALKGVADPQRVFAVRPSS
jgi:class 3 adenylate cyclase